jgi:FixJ family two-component response regulator
MKAGAVDFIEKPIDEARLFAAIDAALAERKPAARDREVVQTSEQMALLSPRERQVLEAIAIGRPTKLIAHDLQSRLIDGGHQIPIIFITAYSDENARAHALKAGALGYLVKPFEEADLLNGINLALGQQAGPQGRLSHCTSEVRDWPRVHRNATRRGG